MECGSSLGSLEGALGYAGLVTIRDPRAKPHAQEPDEPGHNDSLQLSPGFRDAARGGPCI